MLRKSLATLAIMSALLAAGCGGKQPESGSSTPAATNTPAPGASSATAIPAVSPYDSGPRASEAPVDKAKAEAGEKLFQTKGCSACHAFGKKVTGPDLAGVSQRRTQLWLEHQILHPDVMTKEDPIARELFAKHSLQMPNQKLTEDEARAVIEYFKHKDHEAG
jgi:mono/diheme cytochrome c family protein